MEFKTGGKTHRARCLDGSDVTIALRGLCPHGVVSQVIWADVSAWTDAHDLRLTDDEVRAATVAFELSPHDRESLPACPSDILASLPNVRRYRGTVNDLVAAPAFASSIEEFQCWDARCDEDAEVRFFAEGHATPRLRQIADVTTEDVALLRRLIERVEGFSGFSWGGADALTDWLNPIPSSLKKISVGYCVPRQVRELLSSLPTTVEDLAVQGWTDNMGEQRHEVFNSEVTLPAHLRAFELLEDQPTQDVAVPLHVWTFIAPAAKQLRLLRLSAIVSPDDLANIISECVCLEELSLRLNPLDDPTVARRLLFSNVGLPMLRRLSIDIDSGDRTDYSETPWRALDDVAAAGPGRATITALSLSVGSPVSGEVLRPFAPRLTELAVPKLCHDAEDSIVGGGDFPLFPLLTSLVLSVAPEHCQHIIRSGQMPKLRDVLSDTEVTDSGRPGFPERGRFRTLKRW